MQNANNALAMHESTYYTMVPTQSAESRSMYVRTTVQPGWSRTVRLELWRTNNCQPQVSSQSMLPEQQCLGTNSYSVLNQPTAMQASVPAQSCWPQASEPRYCYQPSMTAPSTQPYHYQPNMTAPSAQYYHYWRPYLGTESTNSCSILNQPTAMHAPAPMQANWPQVSEPRYNYQPCMITPSAQSYHYHHQQQRSGTASNFMTSSCASVPGPMPNATNMPSWSRVKQSQPHQEVRQEEAGSAVFPASFQQILGRAREDFENLPKKFSENQRLERDHHGEDEEGQYWFGPSNRRRVSGRPTAFRPHFGTLSYTVESDGENDESDAGCSSYRVESRRSSFNQTVRRREGSLGQAVESRAKAAVETQARQLNDAVESQPGSSTHVGDQLAGSSHNAIMPDQNERNRPNLIVPERTCQADGVRPGFSIRLKIQEQQAYCHTNRLEYGSKDHSSPGSLPCSRCFDFALKTLLLLGRNTSTVLNNRPGVVRGFRPAKAINGMDNGLFASELISDVQGAIYEKNGELILEDWDSAYGTYVNSYPVDATNGHILQHQDIIQLGGPHTNDEITCSRPIQLVVHIEKQHHVIAEEGEEELEKNINIDNDIEVDESDMTETKGGLHRRDSGHGQSSSDMDIDDDLKEVDEVDGDEGMMDLDHQGQNQSQERQYSVRGAPEPAASSAWSDVDSSFIQSRSLFQDPDNYFQEHDTATNRSVNQATFPPPFLLEMVTCARQQAEEQHEKYQAKYNAQKPDYDEKEEEGQVGQTAADNEVTEVVESTGYTEGATAVAFEKANKVIKDSAKPPQDALENVAEDVFEEIKDPANSVADMTDELKDAAAEKASEATHMAKDVAVESSVDKAARSERARITVARALGRVIAKDYLARIARLNNKQGSGEMDGIRHHYNQQDGGDETDEVEDGEGEEEQDGSKTHKYIAIGAAIAGFAVGFTTTLSAATLVKF
ncbi:hypothetical protein BGZ95_001619 [Linnemannia exigua]|uniref:FHA domain-containing protein n=1 Tax=Linnemannia exigua TaxID=604196 RepID=A0AAD4D8E2_9FUNG|nr:hypothetical protein BGZ95_001619 [Linnemannia exigua]